VERTKAGATAARGNTRWKRWVAIGVLAAAVAVVGGPYVYIHLIEGRALAPLALTGADGADGSGTAGSGSGSSLVAGGTWRVASGSVVGYRVKEVLFGQSNEAVGRTGAVTGTVTVGGTTVRTATFTVDMTTVASDQDRRDAQFDGRVMETATYPTATFTLTQPLSLGSIPADGATRSVRARGNLTLHGVTRAVVFTLTARHTGSAVQVAGSIPVTFADWGIPNPSFGPVSTEDHGVLEFALNLAHA
jgi:polyisoprenoid-binding protein YceI